MRDGRDAGGSPPLSVFVKLPGVAGEIGLALLLFVLVRTLGYPNPRAIGIVLTIGAAAWALWTAYRSTIHNLQSAIRN